METTVNDLRLDLAPGSPAAISFRMIETLQTAGFEAFWVGGCVRDLLLGRTPHDYDIATNALPDRIEQLFPRCLTVGRQFGVVVVIEQNQQFQIATFRAESDYCDGRHPGKITFGDPEADARRRDFTINGLFLDPARRKLWDWVGGEADLRKKVIRAIGNPQERFTEDHLRVLRAIRFAAQLGFSIDPATWSAIRHQSSNLSGVSAERVREELLRIFQPPHAARGLDLLHESGLLAIVLPEVEHTVGCEQSPGFHPEGSVFNHLRLMLEQMPADAHPLLPWAVLMHDIAKPVTAGRKPNCGTITFYGHEKVGADMTRSVLERLRFPRKDIQEVADAVLYHMQFKDAPAMRTSTLRRMLLRPTIDLELQLHRLDCLGSHHQLDIYEYLRRQQAELHRKPALVPPLLNGHDLQALGVLPGPQMGALLDELRDLQLQEDLTTAEQAREWVRRRLS